MTIKLGTNTFVMILLTILILIVQMSTRATALPNVKMVYNACWDTGTPLGDYADAVRRIRDLLKTRTHINGNDYRTLYAQGGVDCFGRAWCRNEISNRDCQTCLEVADTRIISICPNPLRALMGLVDCSMRIDNLPITDE